MPLRTEFLAPFVKHSKTFIETGSLLGDGIQAALDAGFKEVYSIELSAKFYKHCQERFAKHANVHLIQGDSSVELGKLISSSSLTGPCVFWLDGHYSAGETARGTKDSPLLEELAQIARARMVVLPILLIDDMRCWIKSDAKIGFGPMEIISSVRQIHPGYQFAFQTGDVRFPNDVLVATPSNPNPS